MLRFTLLIALVAAPSFASEYTAEESRQYLTNTLSLIPNGDYAVREMEHAVEIGERVLGKNDPLVVRVRSNAASMRLFKACGAAREPLENKLRRGQQLTDADLKPYDDAVAAFTLDPSADLQYWADAESKKPAELRSDSTSIAKRAADEKARVEHEAAFKQAERDAEAKRAADAAASRAELAARSAASESAASSNVVPPDQIAALGDQELRRHYERLALWSAPDPKAQSAIAAALHGELVAKGSVAGKSFSTSFAVKPDSCYVVVTEIARFSGAEGSDPIVIAPKSGSSSSSSSLQRFAFDANDGGQRMAGLCATKAATVTASTKLQFPGTKNGTRFAVLAWKRAAFPADLARSLILAPIDDCDAALWTSLWTHPVPGTLVYKGREPFLVVEGAGLSPATSSFDLRDVATGKAHAMRKELAKKAPAHAAFGTPFLRRTPRKPGEPIVVVADSAQEYGCAPDETFTSPDAKALFACYQSIDKKFAKSYDDVDRMRGQAARMGGIAPKAEALRGDLDDAAAAELARRCGPIEKRITNAMERAYNQIVDAYADKPLEDVVDRLAAP